MKAESEAMKALFNSIPLDSIESFTVHPAKLGVGLIEVELRKPWNGYRAHDRVKINWYDRYFHQ